LKLLDQRILPHEVVFIEYDDVEALSGAIREMVVRGAPAIGVTAAYGMVISAAAAQRSENKQAFLRALKADAKKLRCARPTAVNLAWAVDRLLHLAQDLARMGAEPPELLQAMEEEALRIHQDDIASCKAIGRHGLEFIPQNASILTHCNAGALATGGYGTALGVIRAAVEAQRKIHVYVDETRPFLQGARLTAWELHEENVPSTLICDNMAGTLMAKGKIDVVVVGADRIAANGDVANKVGTFPLAVLADFHSIPFLVAAPRSTFDPEAKSGDDIPIEERPESEVLTCRDTRFAPEGVRAFNPAFDVTPHNLIHAILTEDGPIRPVDAETVGRFLSAGL
jgi:methylthioribose-1-phosphate isomerase